MDARACFLLSELTYVPRLKACPVPIRVGSGYSPAEWPASVQGANNARFMACSTYLHNACRPARISGRTRRGTERGVGVDLRERDRNPAPEPVLHQRL
jgi:hypothetical protein